MVSRALPLAIVGLVACSGLAGCSRSKSSPPRREAGPAATAPAAPDAGHAPQEKTMFELSPDAAVAHGLPALRVRLDTAGTPMLASATPEPGKYVIVSGPPGGVLQLDVWTSDQRGTDAAAIERAVRARLSQPYFQPLVVGAAEEIELAGARRTALALFSGSGMVRTAWCATLITAGSSTALVTIGMAAGAEPEVPCSQVLAHPVLGKLAATLSLDG